MYIYIYVHLLVCYLNKLQNAQCNDKDKSEDLVCEGMGGLIHGSSFFDLSTSTYSLV